MIADSYRTVSQPTEARITRTRSRFICHLEPVQDEDGVGATLDAIRKQRHDATHHCFAFRILESDRCRHGVNDDGEPRGSAGEPILRQLEAAKLVNVVAVVTRYFGGAKLGIGGLIRAYGAAAEAAIETATVVRRVRHRTLKLDVPQEAGGAVMGLIHRFDGVVQDAEYRERASIVVRLAPSRVPAFTGALQEVTGGQSRWKALP
jgi:uncharacterized YigZ family protein